MRRQLKALYRDETGRGSLAARCLTAFIAVLGLHISAPSGYAVDALAYAAAIRDGSPLFHPHHILYGPSVLIFARALKLLGITRPEIVGAHIHNLFWAGLAVYAMAVLVGRATQRTVLGLWGALLLAATAGVGVFATQNDVYVPALACTVALLCGLQRFEQTRTTAALRFAAGAWALATLYHQTAIFLALPIFWFVLSVSGFRQGFRHAAMIAGPAGALTFLFYMVGFAYEGSGPSPHAFARFVLEYAYSDIPLWRNPANFSLVGLYQVLESQTKAIITVEPSSLRLLAVATMVVLLGGSAAPLVIERDRLGIAGVLGLAVFLTFNLWWLPSEPELAIVPVAFCVIIVSLALATLLRRVNPSSQRVILVGAFMAVTTLAGSNAVTNARFQTLIAPEKLHVAESLGNLNRQGCAILDEYLVSTSVRYFFGHPAADMRRFLIRHFQDQEPEAGALVRAAPCLLMRAQWLDPETRVVGYSGRELPEAWRRAVLSLLAKSAAEDQISAWRVHVQDIPSLGRVLLVSRSESIERTGDEFWAFVATEIRAQH